MKNYLIAGLLLLAAACTNQKKAGDFVPGTYVNHAESEYSIADDTLVIVNSFQVTRRTGFQRKGGQPEHKTKIYAAVWDETKHTLQLTDNGLIIQFGSGQVIIANTKYRKL